MAEIDGCAVEFDHVYIRGSQRYCICSNDRTLVNTVGSYGLYEFVIVLFLCIGMWENKISKRREWRSELFSLHIHLLSHFSDGDCKDGMNMLENINQAFLHTVTNPSSF